jgi:hypothetical protein
MLRFLLKACFEEKKVVETKIRAKQAVKKLKHDLLLETKIVSTAQIGCEFGQIKTLLFEAQEVVQSDLKEQKMQEALRLRMNREQKNLCWVQGH